MTTRTLLIELKWDLLVVQIVCHNHTEKFSLLWFYYSVLPEAQKSSFILWYCTTKAKIQLDFQLYIRLTAALFCRLKIFALLDLNLSFFHGEAGWDCFSGMSWRIPLTFCSLLFFPIPKSICCEWLWQQNLRVAFLWFLFFTLSAWDYCVTFLHDVSHWMKRWCLLNS